MDLVTDLEVAGDRECADTGCFILYIDRIEERGVLIVAGSVGCDDTFNDEDQSFFTQYRSISDFLDRRYTGFLIQDIQIDIAGDRDLFFTALDDSGNCHVRVLCDIEGADIRINGESAVCRDGLLRRICCVDLAAAVCIDDGSDRCLFIFMVEEDRVQCDICVGVERFFCRGDLFDAQIESAAEPDRCCDDEITVCLCDSDKVVSVLDRQFRCDVALCEFFRIVPGIGDRTVVDDEFDLLHGIAAVRIIHRDLRNELLRHVFFCEDSTHLFAVGEVGQFKVLVFCRIDTESSDRIIDAFFGEVFSQDDVTGVIRVAPASLVVILVVGRS